MTYWKNPPEFARDLETVDMKLTNDLGRRPSAIERAKALHISRPTLYVWLDKLEKYETQGTRLKAVGE
jgi:hypothetical protein